MLNQGECVEAILDNKREREARNAFRLSISSESAQMDAKWKARRLLPSILPPDDSIPSDINI